jgi:hypothetical protein
MQINVNKNIVLLVTKKTALDTEINWILNNTRLNPKKIGVNLGGLFFGVVYHEHKNRD